MKNLKYIVVFIVVVFLFWINLKGHLVDNNEDAVSDFLEAVAYEEVDFDIYDIAENLAIIEEIETMIEISLNDVELSYVHAESSLDDNLSIKGHIELSLVENFLQQFTDEDKRNVYSKEFGKEIVPFGDKSLKWWNPIFTESSKTANITYLENSIKILITPVNDNEAEIYIFWFEM